MSLMEKPLTFDVVPGRTYELQLLLQSVNKTENILSRISLNCLFYDCIGNVIDKRIVKSPAVVGELDPMVVEVLPYCALSDDLTAGGLAQRFILVPPDAITLKIEGVPQDINIVRAVLSSLAIGWCGRDGRQALSELVEISDLRAAILDRYLDGDITQFSDLLTAPVRQFQSLLEWFTPGGDWSNVVDRLKGMGDLADFQLRMDRLAAQATERLPVIGFIGSERGRERLQGFSKLVWLRSNQFKVQLSSIKFDAIVIENSLYSGTEGRDWALAFSSLNGDLPTAGAQLFDEAEDAGVPVHLWLTGDDTSVHLWRDCIARAGRVIAEGNGWLSTHVDARVPRATEPAACSLASLTARQSDLMLIPVASDLLQFSDFKDFVATGSLYQPLFAEFRYAFSRKPVEERLNQTSHFMLTEIGRAEQRVLLQAATIVLLPAVSLRTDIELLEMAMDAIASGAIPIMYGTPRSDDVLLGSLDVVQTVSELIYLQGMYRIRWLHERRWRELMSFVIDGYVWKSADRVAVLGFDPMPADFDQPRVSVVLVTKRPHFLHKCFETFRRQTWLNTELIMVFNTGNLPDDLPELRENEHVYTLPEAANIGECLNRGIALTTGRIWCKIDDDDFYSDRYISDTVAYYRSSQADIVGRQSGYFYFSGQDVTISREFVGDRNFCLLGKGAFVSGATLSASKLWAGSLFSVRDRNQADSNWVSRVAQENGRIFSAGYTEMVVYRDAIEDNHTWRMSPDLASNDRYLIRANGNMFQILEKT